MRQQSLNPCDARELMVELLKAHDRGGQAMRGKHKRDHLGEQHRQATLLLQDLDEHALCIRIVDLGATNLVGKVLLVERFRRHAKLQRGDLAAAAQSQTQTAVAQDNGPPETLFQRVLDVFAGTGLAPYRHGVLDGACEPQTGSLGLLAGGVVG